MMLVEDPDKRDHESLLWKADPTAGLDQVARGEVCWIGSTWDERDLLRSDLDEKERNLEYLQSYIYTVPPGTTKKYDNP